MQPTPETQRKAAWGRWLDEILTRRELRNSDLARLLAKAGAGERYTNTSLISQWRRGDAGPSETAALFIAKALGVPGLTVLRAAGHTDTALLIEEMLPDGDPRLARIHRSGLSPQGQAAAEDFVHQEDRSLTDRLDRLLQAVYHGEQIAERNRQAAAQDDDRDAS